MFTIYICKFELKSTTLHQLLNTFLRSVNKFTLKHNFIHSYFFISHQFTCLLKLKIVLISFQPVAIYFIQWKILIDLFSFHILFSDRVSHKIFYQSRIKKECTCLGICSFASLICRLSLSYDCHCSACSFGRSFEEVFGTLKIFFSLLASNLVFK